MADIKNLSIFGNSNKGLSKIKEQVKMDKKKKEKISDSKIKTTIQSTRIIRGVGAPIKNHDQVYTTKVPLKLSAITVSLTRILSEKYMTENTRDEILRISLNEYIKHHFTKEDKEDLLNDIQKELSIFREEHPTTPSYDENGLLEKTPEDLESETMNYFINHWGIKNHQI